MPKGALGGVGFGGSWGSLGALLSAPGLLWGTIWGAFGKHLERFLVMFVSQSGVRRENSEKLEFDDFLYENAMFLRPQGFQNETNMAPKLAERKKKSREEATREDRVPWEPSRPAWGRFLDFLRFQVPRGGGGLFRR